MCSKKKGLGLTNFFRANSGFRTRSPRFGLEKNTGPLGTMLMPPNCACWLWVFLISLFSKRKWWYPIKLNISNKYPLYKVYMGYHPKGTTNFPWFLKKAVQSHSLDPPKKNHQMIGEFCLTMSGFWCQGVLGSYPFKEFEKYPAKQKLRLPPTIMVQWKMDVSPILVSFHVGWFLH